LLSVHQLLSGSYKDSQTEKESDDWLNYVPSIDSEIIKHEWPYFVFEVLKKQKRRD